MFASETSALYAHLIPRRSWRWIAAIGLWLAVAFVSSLHWRLFYYPADPYETLWQLFRGKALLWLVWGALTPLILWLGAKFFLRRRVWMRNLVILTACSLVVTTAYILAYALIIAWNREAPLTAFTYSRFLEFAIDRHSTYFYLAFWTTIAIEQLLGYYRRMHERELQASQLERQLATAQLQALQAQLHPHFLFNTLNTISSTILEEKPEQAYDMVARLGELLRTTLERNERQIISLEEELEFTEQYLSLLSSRFGERLHIAMVVPPDMLEIQVPSLILQPLVENAVKHGVAKTSADTSVQIEVSRDATTVTLHVITICAAPGFPRMNGEGLGHRLTRDRLACLYGANYQFSAVPQAGQLTVRLQFPVQPSGSGM